MMYPGTQAKLWYGLIRYRHNTGEYVQYIPNKPFPHSSCSKNHICMTNNQHPKRLSLFLQKSPKKSSPPSKPPFIPFNPNLCPSPTNHPQNPHLFDICRGRQLVQRDLSLCCQAIDFGQLRTHLASFFGNRKGVVFVEGAYTERHLRICPKDPSGLVAISTIDEFPSLKLEGRNLTSDVIGKLYSGHPYEM